MAVAAGPTREELTRLLAAFDEDFPFYAESCLEIVDKTAHRVPFVLNEPQLRFWREIKTRQIDRGLPVRAIILKSRQIGFSTEAQGLMIHRLTRRPNRRGLVVALDRPTGGNLFTIGETMYNALPAGIPGLKPPVTNRLRDKLLAWGEPSRELQMAGSMGLNSSLRIDTAQEVQAGRGFTFTDLHLSEVAFWEQASKMTALLNAVPEDPGTMVILESTANGANFFKHWWERAERGESQYIPFFVGWLEDPSCQRPFANAAEREEFVASIGEGAFGEAEPQLIELFGATPEQLHFRRWAIVDRCQGKIELFNQEYPTTAEEAFILSGQHRFSTLYIQRAIEQARRAPAPELGVLKVTEQKMGVKARVGTVDVPVALEFVAREKAGMGSSHPYWHVWELPDPEKDYVVAMDPMGGGTNDSGERAYHAIQVIDQRSRKQVARWKGRLDADLAGMQALYAAIFYGRAWLAVETTGGYGGAVARRHYEDFKYPFVYRKKAIDKLTERTQKSIGWDTNTRTKPWLEETMTELLREQTHGIVDIVTALELSTYVEDEKGKTGPADGAFSDCLMAYMIAQFVAREKPLKRRKKE